MSSDPTSSYPGSSNPGPSSLTLSRAQTVTITPNSHHQHTTSRLGTSERVRACERGLDLEMPGLNKGRDAKLVAAVQEGRAP